MGIVEIRKRALSSEAGEYVLGLEDTGSHACYMIYGVLRSGEKRRLVKPGAGHEEIVLAVKSSLVLSGAISGQLEEGEAFHIAGDTEVFLENTGLIEAVYVIAGGHSDGGHHH
jgi:hypothetical protein